eukprot:9186108-Lingulodinium_polyedra.AAC.1
MPRGQAKRSGALLRRAQTVPFDARSPGVRGGGSSGCRRRRISSHGTRVRSPCGGSWRPKSGPVPR